MSAHELARTSSKAVRSQSRANRSTREHWTYFASHRAEIHKLLVTGLRPSAEPAGRLCVLGAGNCNDIDVPALLETFAEVHLVDIDAGAVGAAVERQGVASSPRVRLHGGVDLTGMAARFADWDKAPPTDGDVLSAAREIVWPGVPDVGGPFDAVLSPCLLSQLVGYASDVLGGSHQRRRELLVALRRRHLRQVTELLTPSGTGLIVCDVASSDGHPELHAAPRSALPAILDRLTYTDRGFDGLSPASMRDAVTSDPLIAPLLATPQLISPWLWTLGPRRRFLVYAMRLRRLGVPLLG